MPFVLNVNPQCSHSTVSLVVTVGETRVLLSSCSLFGLLSLDFLIVCISTRYSSVVASFRLGLVYLFLYPSLFIRSADWRQLFWYLLVFALFVANSDPGCSVGIFSFLVPLFLGGEGL